MTVFARKKPVTIECMKWTGENSVEVKYFCGDKVTFIPDTILGHSVAAIQTLEGTMSASPGDIIIKGVNGEFYPCKPGIFKKTYEFVDTPETKPTDFVHSFSWALDRLKEGKRIHRAGWNGKGMCAVLQKGYPDGIPCNKQTAEAWGICEDDPFRCEAYMQLKLSDGSHCMWVPTIGDCLSNDWAIV